MLNDLLERMRAAMLAFKDPALVGEARGMRQVVQELGDRNEFAFLQGQYHKGVILPIVKRVPYDQRMKIRDITGWF